MEDDLTGEQRDLLDRWQRAARDMRRVIVHMGDEQKTAGRLWALIGELERRYQEVIEELPPGVLGRAMPRPTADGLGAANTMSQLEMDSLPVTRPGRLPWQTDEDRRQQRESVAARLAQLEGQSLQSALQGSVTHEDDKVGPQDEPQSGQDPIQMLRWRSDGSLDEVVVSGCDVHIERMHAADFWIGMSRGHGSAAQTLHLHIAGLDDQAVEAYVADDELGCTEEEA